MSFIMDEETRLVIFQMIANFFNLAILLVVLIFYHMYLEYRRAILLNDLVAKLTVCGLKLLQYLPLSQLFNINNNNHPNSFVNPFTDIQQNSAFNFPLHNGPNSSFFGLNNLDGGHHKINVNTSPFNKKNNSSSDKNEQPDEEEMNINI